MPARQKADRAFHCQKRLHAGKEVELVVRHGLQLHEQFALNGFYGVVGVDALAGVDDAVTGRRRAFLLWTEHDGCAFCRNADNVNRLHWVCAQLYK